MTIEYQTRPVAASPAIDAGLQQFMRGVFNTMSLGLAFTGLVAYFIAATPALSKAIFGTGLVWVAIFAPLVFLMGAFRPGRVATKSAASLRATFFVFSGVMGVSMASLFLAFTGESVARAFFITAGTFAGISLYGYTTKRDLTAMGSFLAMGMIGLVLASVVNIFLSAPGLQFAISVLGVGIFTGLTAFEVQRLKESYAYGGGGADKLAVMGALNLYLNFINLFQSLLSLMGQRRE